MGKSIAEGEVAICYIDKYREYGIDVLDGGTSIQVIEFCPWCGRKLLSSLRNQWLDEIEQLGLTLGDTRIPAEYLSDEWWKKPYSQMQNNGQN
jgi:hypothetical protein